MEQLTTRIGIEPGLGLVGRFGDTVIVIPRGGADTRPDDVAYELLELAAEGETLVSPGYLIERGHAAIAQRFNALGADVAAVTA